MNQTNTKSLTNKERLMIMMGVSTEEELAAKEAEIQKKIELSKNPTAAYLKGVLQSILKNPDAAFSSYDRIYENRFKSPEDLIQSYRQAIAEAEDREARAKAQAS